MIIFISYNWNSQCYAIDLQQILHSKNGSKQDVKTLIDIDHIIINKSIGDYMMKITDADYATTIVCGDYLKANNCIKVLLSLHKAGQFKQKFLPLALMDTDIFSNVSLHDHYLYWHKQYLEAYEMAKELGPDANSAIWDEVAFFRDASNLVCDVIISLRDKYHIRLKNYLRKTVAIPTDDVERINKEISYFNAAAMESLCTHLNI